jgi:hypothetical protein
MKQVDAKREILREWRALPKEQRQTEADATRFAFTILVSMLPIAIRPSVHGCCGTCH